MATRRKSRKSARNGDGTVQAQLLEIVSQIWLAGLGAVSKAQKGAPKLLHELVTEGARVHADTREAAEKALQGVMGDVQSTLNEKMSQVRGKATDAFENLEKVFQTRVHRALNQLGVPSADEVESLSKRVHALNVNIEKLAQARSSASRPRGTRKTAHARVAAS
ncbi:MAG TPA: phasin family protein [Steroidobacteraceae bacterium]|nr:phasin family protein [Steroidobacteraceae bacterium]